MTARDVGVRGGHYTTPHVVRATLESLSESDLQVAVLARRYVDGIPAHLGVLGTGHVEGIAAGGRLSRDELLNNRNIDSSRHSDAGIVLVDDLADC